MICAECSTPVLALYEKYKGNHIRLTICDNCHKVADKYIEYDKVLLFIDLMLLKPQAYKHTIYNLLMPEDITTCHRNGVNSKQDHKRTSLFSLYWSRHSASARLMVLMLLFEVYLTWAYEEKNYNESGITTSLVIKQVLDNSPVFMQYVFFLSQTTIDTFILHMCLQLFIYHFLGFGEEQVITFQCVSPITTGHSQRSRHSSNNNNSNSTANVPSLVTKTKIFSREYFSGIIAVTILVSNLVKLFPIVMLIWPYDNFILNVTRTLVQMIHLLILIEAIHIVLMKNEHNQYWKVSSIVASSYAIKFIISHLLTVAYFSLNSPLSFTDFITDETDQMKLKVQLFYELLDYIGV